jgi:hypothetical protein
MNARLRRIGALLAVCVAAWLVANSAGITAANAVTTYPLHTESGKWAGGYVGHGVNFTHAQGSWKVPSVTCAAFPGRSWASQWVGIDGDTSQYLLQAGSLEYCAGSTAAPVYTIFWEKVPYNSPQTVARVAPGSTLTVDVRYTQPGTSIYVVTIRVNGAVIKTLSSKFPAAPRSSAECAVESMQIGGVVQPLAKFSTTTFSRCAVALKYSSTLLQLAAGSRSGITAYRLTGVHAVTSIPGASGAPWTVTWKAA